MSTKTFAGAISRNGLLLLLIIAALIAGVYYNYNHQRDKRIANQVYQQLLDLDQRLDQLEQAAQQLSAEKHLNKQIITTVDGLTKDNYVFGVQQLQQLLAQAGYTAQLSAKFSSEIKQLTPGNQKQFKLELKQLRMTARELKYQQNQAVINFNQQISQLSTELTTISQQIKQINADNLQALELAKLKFISNKLSMTASQLKPDLVEDVVTDIATALIRESDV